MSEGCTSELTNLAPTINSCPQDNETILFCNVTGEPGGYAFRKWSTLVSCLITKIFGAGILTVTGDQLDGSNRYVNANMITNLLVFYNGLNRFLVFGTEWRYTTVGGIAGIQILIGGPFTIADYFTIFPNPQ